MQRFAFLFVLLGSTVGWAQSGVELPLTETAGVSTSTPMDLNAVRVEGAYAVAYSAVVGADVASVHAKTPFTLNATVNVDTDETSTVVWLSDVAISGDDTGHLRSVFLSAPFFVPHNAGQQPAFMSAVDDAHRRLLLRLVHSLMPPNTVEQNGRASAPFGERSQLVQVNTDPTGANRWHLSLVEQSYGKGMRTLTFVPQAASTVVEATNGHLLRSIATDLIVDKRHRGRTVSVERFIFSAHQLQPLVQGRGARTTVRDVVAEGRLGLYAVPQQYEDRLANQTFSDIANYFDAHIEHDYAEANARLRYWLRLHPASSQTAIEWINRFPKGRAFRERRGFALSAVAAAGHLEAQHALQWALTHSDSTPETKERAAKAMLSLEMPEPFLMQSMLAAHANVPTTTLAARQHRAMLLNLFAAMGGKEHGVENNTNFAVAVLREKLHNAEGARAKGEVLVALGNTGAFDDAYAIALPFFKAESVTLRRRAFHVFQKARGDQAFQLFRQHYNDEADASVRRSAAHLAHVIAPSSQRTQWAATQLSNSRDTTVRSIAADVLGQELRTHPKNATLLFAALQTERNPEVRDTLFRFISIDGQPHASSVNDDKRNPFTAAGWIEGAQ